MRFRSISFEVTVNVVEELIALLYSDADDDRYLPHEQEVFGDAGDALSEAVDTWRKL